MGTNSYQDFAELVEQYVAAARSSAQASTSQPSVSYPQYDPRDQRRYYENQGSSQLYSTNNPYQYNNDTLNMPDAYQAYQQPGTHPQPFNSQHYVGHLTSVNENPDRIPYDRRLERSMGYRNNNSRTKQNNELRTQIKFKSVKGAKEQNKPAKPQDYNIIICDICKISCAGDLPYKEHLRGKQHKKKELASKLVTPAKTKEGNPAHVAQTNKNTSDNTSQFIHCNICDVTCCGKESYESHLRGAKHKKVVDLSKKIGNHKDKRIPPLNSDNQISIKVLGAPIINFVKGGRLHTIDNKVVEIPEDEDDVLKEASDCIPENVDDRPKPNLESSNITDGESIEVLSETVSANNSQDDLIPGNLDMNKEPQNIDMPVEPNTSSYDPELFLGEEYVQEIKTEDKIIGYECKLCDCQFNNLTARLDHLKGKRHKFKYSQKNVQIKENKTKAKKRKSSKEKANNKRTKLTQNLHGQNLLDKPNAQIDPPVNLEGNLRLIHQLPRASTIHDEFLLKILSKTKPREEELEEMHHIVSTTERALKLISDDVCNSKVAEENTQTATSSDSNLMKGVVRVGILPKKLVVADDKHVHLVLLCERWPTEELLHRVADDLPEKLKIVDPDGIYTIVACPIEACIMVHSCDHRVPTNLDLSVRITLTSTKLEELLRANNQDQEKEKNPNSTTGLLNQIDCLKGLAEIRHSKQIFENPHQDIDLARKVLRLMRVLCRNSTIWCKLDLWTLEILVERIIASACDLLSIYEATRRLFESLSSGILLPFGVGLLDPCEDNPVEITKNYKPQDLEDITRGAHQVLRQIAYGNIESIFAIEEEN